MITNSENMGKINKKYFLINNVLIVNKIKVGKNLPKFNVTNTATQIHSDAHTQTNK